MRLDRFVQKHIPRLSRTRVQEIIARGILDGVGRTGKAARRVQVGEVFSWCREVEVEALRPIVMPVVHEDDRVVVLNKPGDLVVHPTERVWRNTVTAWLREHRPDAKIAHRLDRETSGVLVCGKGTIAPWLKEKFRLGTAKKTYLAIVKGVPDFDDKRVDHAIMLDDKSPLKVKMRVDPSGLPSVTDVRVLQRFADHALVECKPHTGRQHQIRVHLWALGYPLLGDKLYGVDDDIFREGADFGATDRVIAATGAPRHMLHAAVLDLGDGYRFEADMHEDMHEHVKRVTTAA
jgi:23S rRNA pseudouridine1911/1915/1917 synthase